MLLSVPSEHEKVPLWTFLMCCRCTFFYTVLTWLIITGICWAVGHTATHMVHPSDPSLGLNGWGNGVALQRSNTSCVSAYKTIRLLKLLPLHNTCIFPSMHHEPVFLLYLFICPLWSSIFDWIRYFWFKGEEVRLMWYPVSIVKSCIRKLALLFLFHFLLF